MKNDGFISLDVLMALFIISIIFLIHLSSLNNIFSFYRKNTRDLDLISHSKNFIEKEILERGETKTKSELRLVNSLDLIDENYEITINKIVKGNLWKLDIVTRDPKEDKNLSWVIVIEKPEK